MKDRETTAGWSRGLVALSVSLASLVLSACPKPPTPLPPPTPTPVPTPTPIPTPKPIPALVRKPLPTATLFSGISLESAAVTTPSGNLASEDRLDADAYKLELTLRAQLPRPALSVEDLEASNSSLSEIFKDLPVLLTGASVSPFFEKFYELKTNDLQRKLANLDALLTRHNFYDCQTMLELENPATSRRALLLIADMDVNTDGSDGDRNVQVDSSSIFFLPQTSYRWPKQTDRPNPMLAVEEKKLAEYRAEKLKPDVKPARLTQINEGIDLATRRVHDLKKWSFLVSSVDPFIVLPGFIMRDHNGPFVPKIGDYAIVIHAGRAYPAIVGDSGPSQKVGEASLRLCREVSQRSSNIIRATSDLNVTYLVFPGSADETPAQPDLGKWREKCTQLAEELGGLKVPLHDWPNLVPPWPTPTPTPSLEQSSGPADGGTPKADSESSESPPAPHQ
ncbi:MAG: glycoside hydrolase family 75 protein [bacterium]